MIEAKLEYANKVNEQKGVAQAVGGEARHVSRKCGFGNGLYF